MIMVKMADVKKAEYQPARTSIENSWNAGT